MTSSLGRRLSVITASADPRLQDVVKFVSISQRAVLFIIPMQVCFPDSRGKNRGDLSRSNNRQKPVSFFSDLKAIAESARTPKVNKATVISGCETTLRGEVSSPVRGTDSESAGTVG